MNSPESINNAPYYLKSFVAPPKSNGPSELLLDGSWCGHGEPLFRVYDVIINNNSVFTIQLPDTESEELLPIAVKLSSENSKNSFLVYDTREHPASLYSLPEYALKNSKFSTPYCCEKCASTKFKISIGLEIPVDSETTNDISWFALATECVNCGDKTIAFEDETA